MKIYSNHKSSDRIGQRTMILSLATLVVFWSSHNLKAQKLPPLQAQVVAEETIQVSSTPFYVFKDGEFREAILSKEPELIGGKDLMETLIRLNMRYPEKAKEKHIGGTVIISVVIDNLGQMEDAFVLEGIGGGCNDEALRAVRLMDKVGFEPGEINGKPVTVRFNIPITFMPQ